MDKISTDYNFKTFLDPIEVTGIIVFVISLDENLVINEMRLNRIKID